MNVITSDVDKIANKIKNWWIHLLFGAVFIILGFIILVNPVASYLALAVFFAVAMLINGLLQIIFAVTNRNRMQGWGWQLAVGIMELFLGIIIVGDIRLTLVTLPFFVGFWLMFRGTDMMGVAFFLRSAKTPGWVLYLILGIVLMIFSWFIILDPMIGGITIIIWTAISAFIAGISYIVIALKLKKMRDVITQISPDE
jgi:uncharacterized membrane protein HdeD (DUF308 family)